jgi:ectoine hydroxylase-related dioxygenase (phytanoyl-CoA dioxygenase family)
MESPFGSISTPKRLSVRGSFVCVIALDVAALQSELWTEGYFVARAALSPALVAACRTAVERAVADEVSTVAAFADDAPWELERALVAFADAALGADARLRPAMWAWHLAPDAPRGWKPHRDRPAIDPDPRGAPRSITLWVALTDATPENGCMYVVPAPLDVQYANPNASDDVWSVQCVRALPAPAGSVLGWSSSLLHWGGVARAGTPGRTSLSFEYQTADVPTPSYPRGWSPSRAERAAIILAQWDQYAHMHGESPAARERLAAHRFDR